MYIHGPRKAAKHLSVKKAAYLWIFWNIVCKFAPFRFSIFILVFFIFYFLKYHLNRRSPALVFRKKKKKVIHRSYLSIHWIATILRQCYRHNNMMQYCIRLQFYTFRTNFRCFIARTAIIWFNCFGNMYAL